MTDGQRKMVRELMRPPGSMRVSRRELEEVQRIDRMSDNEVLSVEVAAWLERVYARVKKATSVVKR